MNERGQVLVVFIIILPLILLVLSLIIDLGSLYNEKRMIDNNVKSALEYALDNVDDKNIKEKTTKLLNKNIDDIDTMEIIVDNKNITIRVDKKCESIFKTTKIKEYYEIKSNYVGNIENKRITKEG